MHPSTGQVISTTSEESDLHEVITLQETSEDHAIPWRNTYSMRPHILAAMANGRASGRTSNANIQKMRLKLFTNASKSLDLVRQNLQTAINDEINAVIHKYLETFFQPAVKNIRGNLGANSVTEDVIREVCRNMLEEAKQMYSPINAVANQKVTSTSNSERKDENYLENIPGYPPLLKWDPSRVKNETQFILSTSATKALGVGTTQAKQCLKHPDLVRYLVDQDDREWLGTALTPGLVPGTPNLSLIFLEDILYIINLEDYNNPNLVLGELRGFVVPDFIQRKIRAYMTLMRTKYLPSSTSGSESAGIGGVECVSSSEPGLMEQGDDIFG
ncbi:hypothetical protein GE061_018064 [Apolygus lucorum]|uniref:DNTTIP1 dimerisation domain-containing protein n=1 Tax=Apolygus lucorum TaxID=248454 RepID=A0A8S9XEX4_APOLU|nr:hypothetical protein GE061_018064 [Apolygus lucorum]